MTTPSIARSSLAMAGGSVASRILGIVRQSLIVLAIGQGLTGNAFTTANTLPNIIYMVIAGGVLNSVLVPQLVKAAKNADGGRDYTDRILTLAGAGFLVVTVVCTLGAGVLIRLYATQLEPDAMSLATFFAFVTIPQIFFYGMYSVLGQVLNARGQLAAFGWAPALANVVQIIGLVAFMGLFDGHVNPGRWTAPMVWVFAGTATLSIVVQALFLLVPLWRAGFRWTPRFGVRGVGLAQTSKVAGWAFSALVLSQLGYLVASNVMWHASDQSRELGRFIPGIAVYANALFVFMVPHSLIALSIITALYPRISAAAHSNDLGVLRREYVRGLTVPTAVTLPASVALLAFAVPVTVLLFSSRDPAEIPATAQVLAAMAIGVVPFGIDVLNQRFFYAHDDGRKAFWEQLVLTGSATAVTLGTLALRPESTVAVIGLGIVLSNVLSSAFGMRLVRRRLGHLGGRAILLSYLRIGSASVVAGAIAWPVVLGFSGLVDGRVGALVTLVVAGGVFAVAYLLMAAVLRIPEVWSLLDPVLARLPHRISSRLRP
ncbi:MAG: murein biosynthesis integral membrane protein MurJ [Actinomycetota bacterium]|nr:murein biosynthesis integral membrane protein MurJ [Actinomycetota bacterium]